ncbi:MAG: 4-hydroxyphenylacetate 3-monooxygenase, oxygenase component [Chloroflexi bacterium]|nr:MAG: 4-hydroxyphenylacetate 3-monooxygenase, oxygenase component [Chloroflexota bacterium]
MGARGGAAYLAGLRDEREIWLDGERIKDVTRDPRLARGIRSIAALYDLQLEPSRVAEMTYISPTSGERVGLSHIQPRSIDDLIRRRNMIKTWAEWSGGMLGRSPDYLNAMVMGCAANADYFAHNDPAYAQNIQRYYELVREQDLCLTHTLVAPQVNRSVHPDQQAGGAVALRVIDETDSGLVLSGARILATLAPASDELFVAPAPSRSYAGAGNPRAFAFAIPVATPGLRFICRESFDVGRSSFDHPLGSRFEEMDCTAVFDRVLVPWERVFLYGDQEYCAALFRDTNVFNHAIHQFLTKNWAKAEFVLGVATLVAEAIGIAEALHVQRLLGEMLHATLTLRAFIRAAEADATPGPGGVWAPDTQTLLTARSLFPEVYPRMVEILQILGSSGLANIPSQASVESPALVEDIERFYQGATLGGTERIRLFRLAWDIACSSFGGRQVLYERYFAGDFYRNVAVHYVNHDKRPYTRRVEAFLAREPSPPVT